MPEQNNPSLTKTTCPGCGHAFLHYSNYVGKICVCCHAYIPPIAEHPIVASNKKKLETLIKTIRKSIRDKGAGK